MAEPTVIANSSIASISGKFVYLHGGCGPAAVNAEFSLVIVLLFVAGVWRVLVDCEDAVKSSVRTKATILALVTVVCFLQAGLRLANSLCSAKESVVLWVLFSAILWYYGCSIFGAWVKLTTQMEKEKKEKEKARRARDVELGQLDDHDDSPPAVTTGMSRPQPSPVERRPS